MPEVPAAKILKRFSTLGESLRYLRMPGIVQVMHEKGRRIVLILNQNLFRYVVCWNACILREVMFFAGMHVCKCVL